MEEDLKGIQEQMIKLRLERSFFLKALKSHLNLKEWIKHQLLLLIQRHEFKRLMKEKKKVLKNNNKSKF